MLIFISLLFISTFISQQTHAQIDPAQAIQLAMKVYESFAAVPQKPTLLIRFQDGRKKKTKLFKWEKFEKADPKQRIHGPFAFVENIANKLAKDKDFNLCELQYYDEGEAITIDDDDSLLEVVEAGPDIGNNKRLIDVICSTEVTTWNGRYRKAKKAYDFAVMTKSEPDETEKEIAVKELENVNLGGYNVDAEGVAVSDLNGDDFLTRALEIAKAFKWDEKTISIIKTVPSSDKIFKSQSYVEFDAASWTFHGSFAKFAAWESDRDLDNGKYSMYVATSKFEFTIPREAREGNLADKYLYGSGGSVKQKYINFFKNVLQWEAIESSKKDLDEPEEDDYKLDANHTD